MISKINKFFTILYILSWTFIGNLVLLNLFLAILLDGFATSAEEIEE
jgi:hypothetical protein